MIFVFYVLKGCPEVWSKSIIFLKNALNMYLIHGNNSCSYLIWATLSKWSRLNQEAACWMFGTPLIFVPIRVFSHILTFISYAVSHSHFGALFVDDVFQWLLLSSVVFLEARKSLNIIFTAHQCHNSQRQPINSSERLYYFTTGFLFWCQ